VAVAGVEVCAEARELERDLARPVGAVDDGEHVRLARPAAELLDRKEDRGRRRDVARDEHARPWRGGGPDLVGVDARSADDVGAAPLGDVGEEELDRAVLVLRGEDLVALPEAQRADDGVHPRGRVQDEGESSACAPT
jgi:hypothetical protein